MLILSKNRTKKILSLVSIPLFIFLAINHPDQKYMQKYQSFFLHGSMIIERTFENYSDISELNDNKKNNFENKIENRYTGSGHAALFSTAIYIWKDNKWFGIGYKQFYKKCRELKTHICSTHPHNIYLDILTSFGLIGILPFIIILLSLLKKSIGIIFSKNNKTNVTNCLFITNIILFFPLQSSGSIFKSYFGFFAFTLIALSISIFNSKKKMYENLE